MSGDIKEFFVSWSGGKDAALACYKTSSGGGRCACLVNMVSEDGARSRSHGLSSDILRAQAKAMGTRLIQKRVSENGYEADFMDVLSGLKRQGVCAGVFGDIDVVPHRDWVERVCGQAGVKAHLPLWLEKRESLVKDLQSAGFRAIVVSTNSKFLGSDWLGRDLDANFFDQLKNMGNVDLCGENGEFHTFVYDGPIFNEPVRFRTGEKRLEGNRWYLEVLS